MPVDAVEWAGIPRFGDARVGALQVGPSECKHVELSAALDLIDHATVPEKQAHVVRVLVLDVVLVNIAIRQYPFVARLVDDGRGRWDRHAINRCRQRPKSIRFTYKKHRQCFPDRPSRRASIASPRCKSYGPGRRSCRCSHSRASRRCQSCRWLTTSAEPSKIFERFYLFV